MKRAVVFASFLAVSALWISPAAASYLVYAPGGGQDQVANAMNMLGFTYDLRGPGSPVTPADITSHQALIVGWSVGGDYSGLNPADIENFVTGNRIITGHDADYHTAEGIAAAATLMNRYVLFAGGSPGNPGIVAFPEWSSTPFGYLPSMWISGATGNLTSEIVSSITPDGLASGLYAGLTPADLSNWGESYHAIITGFDPTLKSFEIGAEGAPVTVGTTVTPIQIPEPSSLVLLAAGLLMAARRMKN
jgi:hypothetical protein